MKLNNREDLRSIREMLAQHMEQFQRETGLQVSVGGISYRTDGSGATVKIQLADASLADDHEVAEWARLVRWGIGFEADDLNKTIGVGSNAYKIVGYNARARKQPIKLQRVPDGKEFKIDCASVLRALGRHDKAREAI